MSQELIEEIKAKETSDISELKDSEVSSQITAQVTMALSTLDSKYKENVANYAQELHECTHKIETAGIGLDLLFKEKEPQTNALIAVEKDIDHEVRMLEHFTEQWIQKTVVVRELEMEMKQLEHLPEHDLMFQNRHEELKRLEQEIGDFELILLKHELEKQNILLKIEPVEHKIRALQKSMRELESKKRYIESSYLHRITQVLPSKKQLLPLHRKER